MTVSEQMRKKLEASFAPSLLEIIDESEKHRGHGGWREGGETHFRLRIVSARFAGLGRVARHRLINEALAEELSGPIHALAIHADAENAR